MITRNTIIGSVFTALVFSPFSPLSAAELDKG